MPSIVAPRRPLPRFCSPSRSSPFVLAVSSFSTSAPDKDPRFSPSSRTSPFLLAASSFSTFTPDKEQITSVDDGDVDDDEIRVPEEILENYDDRDSPKSLDPSENPALDTDHVQQQAVMEEGWKKYLPAIASWAPRVLGGGAVAYVFTKASLYITTNLMGITLTDAVWFGFGSGFLTSTGIAVCGFGFYNTFDSVRPEPVYQAAMKKLADDENVVSMLGPINLMGSGVNSGFLRAYKIDGGDVGFGPGHRGFAVPTPLGRDNKLVWRFPRIQMMFQVYGRDRQALVTVEAFNKSGSTKLNLVAMDILDSDDHEHQNVVLVHGDPERLYIRDQLTGFIRFKKNYLDGEVRKYPSKQ
jgi:hypothetical protein